MLHVWGWLGSFVFLVKNELGRQKCSGQRVSANKKGLYGRGKMCRLLKVFKTLKASDLKYLIRCTNCSDVFAIFQLDLMNKFEPKIFGRGRLLSWRQILALLKSRNISSKLGRFLRWCFILRALRAQFI